MQSNFAPLSGRASVPIELSGSAPKVVQPAAELATRQVVSSHLSLAKARVHGAVGGFFSEGMTRRGEASLVGHHFSYQTVGGPLVIKIARAAQGEYRSLVRQIVEQKRREKMLRHWSALKGKFQELYLAIVAKNEPRKPFSAKQNVSGVQTSTSRPR